MRYIREMARGVNAFLKKKDYYPVLIGMERLDAEACRALRSQLKSDSAIFLSGDNPASVMTGVLHELSALVTSRYHAGLLSMETGCPIAAVSMDERLEGIMRELSFDKDYLLHVDDRNLGRKVFQSLTAAVRQQAAVRKQIRTYRDENKKKLAYMGFFLKYYLEKELRADSDLSGHTEPDISGSL